VRVLLLSYVFPPHPEVGALRAANLLIAFRDAGHQVTLVTEPLPGQVPAIPPGAGPEVKVVSVEPGLPYAMRLGRILRGVRRPRAGGSAAPTADEPIRAQPRPPGPLRSLLLSALSIPDDANYSIAAFTRAGTEALRQGADLIYSSAPPFALHLSARRLHRRSGIPWVAEFRDPWTHPATSRPAALHPLTRGVDRWLERRVLRDADAIVMATEAAKDHVARQLPPERGNRLLVALNGIPEWEAPPPVPPGRHPFRLVHTGSLYMGRDPSDFLAALAAYVRRSGATPSDLAVELIGDARHYQGTPVAATVERLGLNGFVRIEDWLPHAEVRARLFQADALLLLAQHQPLQVPNKLYEYLALRRPILAFVDQEGESARLLRQFPQSRLCYGPDPEQAARVLEELVERRGEPALPDAAALAALSARAQMRQLVDELGRRFG